jgi:hypothetical protein
VFLAGEQIRIASDHERGPALHGSGEVLVVVGIVADTVEA